MTYYYTLTKKDIQNIGLMPTKSNEYEAKQSGWTGEFYAIYEIIENKYGKFRNKKIIDGKDLTEEQKNYIYKCKCEELYY